MSFIHCRNEKKAAQESMLSIITPAIFERHKESAYNWDLDLLSTINT